MAITLRYKSEVTVEERPDTSVAPAVVSSAQPLKHTGFNTSDVLSATTTPPVTKFAFVVKALSGGAGTIDLTALPHDGATVDMTGLKIQALKIKNKSGNAAMTFTEGASNGYALLGAAFSFILLAGQEITIRGNDATPDVASGDRTIDITGTGSQECEVSVIAG